jgi:hypothetical protein
VPQLLTALKDDLPDDAFISAQLVAELLAQLGDVSVSATTTTAAATAATSATKAPPPAKLPAKPPVRRSRPKPVSLQPAVKAKFDLTSLAGKTVAVWPRWIGQKETRYGVTTMADVEIMVVFDDDELSQPYRMTLWGAVTKPLVAHQWSIGRISRRGGGNSFTKADAATTARLVSMLPERG